ncbi:DNA binding protein [Streptomyces phage phiScoe1]|nr:DNA binding protein [Streptomyces phage phiScoe1]
MSCYNRALVEHILPAVWDMEAAYGMKAELVPDADMPRGHKDPKKGSPLFVHIADIKQAWNSTPLTVVERQSLLLRYGLDYAYDEIAVVRGVRKQSAQEGTERAVGKVTAWLNGEKYVDGYDQLEVEQ